MRRDDRPGVTSRVETKTKVEGAVVSFRASKGEDRDRVSVVVCAELVLLYMAGMRVISAAKCGFRWWDPR
jgi:hypothetical protein